MDTERYRDRTDAGDRLAGVLHVWRGREDAVVYGLARGGVPVAAAVAERLGLPLDVLVVRKVGAPANPELAVGAITSAGGMVVNERVQSAMGLSSSDVSRLAAAERETLEELAQTIRGDAAPVSPDGRAVLLVDDGLATGASMSASVAAMRESGSESVTVAVPVASSEAVERLRARADEVVCLMTPPEFSAVGQWYESFGQTSSEEVRRILRRHR